MKPLALPPSLVRIRRKVFEALGSSRYSRLALDRLDSKLEQYLDFDGGYFVEAGANDGLDQSNTYYLERFRGWTGLLIEGIPELAERCRKNRPRAVIESAALVADAGAQKTVEIHYAGLMSAVAGAMGGADATAAHVQRGLTAQEIARTYTVRVPARTLTELLMQHRPTGEIDLLSLDVEGMEAAVLRGLDLQRFAPRFLCIEVRDLAEIAAALGTRYRLREVLVEHPTRRDILFERIS